MLNIDPKCMCKAGSIRVSKKKVFGLTNKFLYVSSLYTTNFIGPLSYQAFSFLKLLALS